MNSPDAGRLDRDIAFLSDYWNAEPNTLDAKALAHFGVSGHPHALAWLQALHALRSQRFDEACLELKGLCSVESLLEPLDRLVQYLYKVFTAMPLSQSVGLGQDMVGQVIQHFPGNLAGSHMALEFMLYFGMFDQAGQYLGFLPTDQHIEYRALLRRAHTRLESFKPRHRFSFCILTWNRADLLDRCLTALKAKAGSEDYEIIVGVNASTDHTAEVLKRHGITQVHWNFRNESIDYYREIMDAAKGEILVEIDDNVVAFPEHFDLILEDHLKAFPDFGYIGIEPTRLSMASGTTHSMHLDAGYAEVKSGDLTLWKGPVWGCCAALRNADYRRINGLYGARLSKMVGEEPQFIRKLFLQGKQSGLICGLELVKAFP